MNRQYIMVNETGFTLHNNKAGYLIFLPSTDSKFIKGDNGGV